jgi:hypothetical protein
MRTFLAERRGGADLGSADRWDAPRRSNGGIRLSLEGPMLWAAACSGGSAGRASGALCTWKALAALVTAAAVGGLYRTAPNDLPDLQEPNPGPENDHGCGATHHGKPSALGIRLGLKRLWNRASRMVHNGHDQFLEEAFRSLPPKWPIGRRWMGTTHGHSWGQRSAAIRRARARAGLEGFGWVRWPPQHHRREA